MTEGKRLEDDFMKSFSGKVFIHRLKTRSSGYANDNEIADFMIYYKDNLFIFETKATKEKRLPFAMIRVNQATGIYNAIKYEGVIGGILVRLYTTGHHFFVPIYVIEEYLQGGKKSIPLADMIERTDIVELNPKRKRVSYEFDITMLDSIREDWK